MITDDQVWEEMKSRGLPTTGADPIYWGIADNFGLVKWELESAEKVGLNQQVRAILESVEVSPDDAIKITVKLMEDCLDEPVNYEMGTHSFELYYKDFTITHHGQAWYFEDDTKDMTFWDVELLSGLLVADKMREQGL